MWTAIFETDQFGIVSDYRTILARQNLLPICQCGFRLSGYDYDFQNTLETRCWQKARAFKFSDEYSSTKYQNEEKQIKNLQLSVPKQINLEVKESAKPIAHNLAKQKVLSLAKKIVPAFVKGSLNDFIELQKTYDEDKMCSSISDLLSEFVSECCVKSIPLDNVDLRKESSKRKHSAMEDAINKMAKKDELSKVSKNQKLKKKKTA